MPLPKLLTLIAALIGLGAALIIGYFVLQPPGDLLTDAGFDRAQISPNADGVDDLATISYTLNDNARISIYLESEDGTRFDFRAGERRTDGDYSVYFSGIVDGYTLPDEEIPGTVERRLMPNGNYTWTIAAVGEDGDMMEKTGTLVIAEADSALPIMTTFETHPPQFTPNQDGIHDRVNVNIYLEKPANLSVYLEDIAGERYYISEREEGREPGDMGSHEFDYDGGVDQGMEPPPDGDYTLYAIAQDDEGQVVTRRSQVTIADGGLPQVEITPQTTGSSVYFETQPYDDATYSDVNARGETIPKPEGVSSDMETITMLQGNLLVFRLTVNNYGSTPVRTAGPFPGAVYEFEQRAASLGEYEQSGAWRVGINCDTAYSDFPWRWALAPVDELEAVYDEATDETYYYLQPGQRAEVWGAVRMTEILEARNPQDCWAGLIHEDVGIPAFQSRVGAREIEIVPPPETD